tara:strand:- start:24589 stop:25296 length:708 start_codon:yes stop_codon:yes gene_type:complete
MKFLLVILVMAIAAALFVAGLKQQWWPVPRQWNPFMPLVVSDPVTPVTRWKLKRIGDDRQACLAALDTVPEGDLDYLPLKDYTPVQACPLNNVVRVRSAGVRFNHSFVARCPLALAWAMFERHQLQPQAKAVFGQPVREVWHYGTFACRNIYHRKDDRRSDHATASALDVAAFTLADGTRVSVLDDWNDDGKRGDFLHRARDGACRFFGTTLSPDYNAAHANHFHLGLRGFGICR